MEGLLPYLWIFPLLGAIPGLALTVNGFWGMSRSRCLYLPTREVDDFTRTRRSLDWQNIDTIEGRDAREYGRKYLMRGLSITIGSIVGAVMLWKMAPEFLSTADRVIERAVPSKDGW